MLTGCSASHRSGTVLMRELQAMKLQSSNIKFTLTVGSSGQLCAGTVQYKRPLSSCQNVQNIGSASEMIS